MWVGGIFLVIIKFAARMRIYNIYNRSVRHFDTTTRQQNNL